MLLPSTRTRALIAVWLLSRGTAARYVLDDLYEPATFFDKFNFFTGDDPTGGFVDYVDRATASTSGMIGMTMAGGVYVGVDHATQVGQRSTRGRKSVRIESIRTYNRGLFITDIAHTPASRCGVWPAFWLYGPEWPNSGEVDIIEGAHTQSGNRVTLHTGPGCVVTDRGHATGTSALGLDCSTAEGCSQHSNDTQSYGDGFNTIGGGIYAMEWTGLYIQVWFFPRSAIPPDIRDGSPDPDTGQWSLPLARFEGGTACDIAAHFREQRIVFNIALCGSWAGSVWNANLECAALASTCMDYVANQPSAFADVFWDIRGLWVYKQLGDESVETPSSTPPPLAPRPAHAQHAFSSHESNRPSISRPISAGGSWHGEPLPNPVICCM